MSTFREGSFGPSSVKITQVQASDPGQDDMLYNSGDRIAIKFNQPTNRAGQNPTRVTKSEIDRVFYFSHSLGADYVGTWPSDDLLIIEIVDSTSAAGSSLLAAAYSSSDNSAYQLPHVDPNGFQVQWTEICSTAFCNPSGQSKSETFATLENALHLYSLLQRGQADPSIFTILDLPCTYSMQPRGLISNIVIVHQGLDLKADFWLYIRFEGRLRDIRNTETFSNFSSLAYEAMLDYNATLGISVIAHENILVPLTGDFGSAQISVTALTISDPDNEDVRYSAGDQLEVKFSHPTNFAFMQAGQVLSKMGVNALLVKFLESQPNDTTSHTK